MLKVYSIWTKTELKCGNLKTIQQNSTVLIPHTTGACNSTTLHCRNTVYLQHGGVYSSRQNDVTVTACVLWMWWSRERSGPAAVSSSSTGRATWRSRLFGRDAAAEGRCSSGVLRRRQRTRCPRQSTFTSADAARRGRGGLKPLPPKKLFPFLQSSLNPLLQSAGLLWSKTAVWWLRQHSPYKTVRTSKWN